MDPDWISQTARLFHVDFHTPPQVCVGEGFDAEAFGDALLAMHVQAVVLFTKCHYGLSYYDTRVGKRHPGLSFDLFGRQVEACKRRNIRVLAYYSVARDSLAYDLNPDWRQQTAHGGAIRLEKGDWGTVCFNSPYADEVIWPQLREFTTQYPVDGVWWDIVEWSPGACYCPYCREQMSVASLDPLNPVQHRAFNEWSIGRFLEGASLVGKHIKQELVYAVNATGGIGRARMAAQFVDQILTEYIPFRHGFLYWIPYAHHMRTLGRPFNACMSHWHKAWDDYGGLKTEAQMQYEAGHALSAGASCLFIDQPPPSANLWSSTIEQIQRTYQWVAEREEWCLPAQSVADIAVLADAVTGASSDARYWNSVQGACKMLREAHFLFDVIDDQATFANYRLIIVPDNLNLAVTAVERLRTYVREGGILVMTHRAGLLASQSRQDSEFALRDVLGVSYRGLAPYTRGYLHLQDKSLKTNLPDQPWVVYDRFLAVAPDPEAEILARVTYPIFEVTDRRSYSHAQAPPAAQAPAWPAAIVRHRYHAGTAIYIAAPLFRTFWEHNTPQYRTILANLLGQLLGSRRTLQAEVGPSVDVLLTTQSNRLIVHLLNYHAERRADLPLTFEHDDPTNRWAPTSYPRPDQPYDRLPAREIIEDVPPRYNVPLQLCVPCKPKSVYLIPGRKPFDVVMDESNTVASFVVPEVHIHQMVVFEFDKDVALPHESIIT